MVSVLWHRTIKASKRVIIAFLSVCSLDLCPISHPHTSQSTLKDTTRKSIITLCDITDVWNPRCRVADEQQVAQVLLRSLCYSSGMKRLKALKRCLFGSTSSLYFSFVDQLAVTWPLQRSAARLNPPLLGSLSSGTAVSAAVLSH